MIPRDSALGGSGIDFGFAGCRIDGSRGERMRLGVRGLLTLFSTGPGVHAFERAALELGRDRHSFPSRGELAGLDQTDFLSPDQKVWCEFGSPQSFCATGRPGPANPPQRSATLDRNGQVTLCDVPVPSLGAACLQNWDSSAPILKVGQETEVGNVLCKSQTSGINCTLTSGRGKGKGFLINSTSVRRIGP